MGHWSYLFILGGVYFILYLRDKESHTLFLLQVVENEVEEKKGTVIVYFILYLRDRERHTLELITMMVIRSLKC